LFVNIIFISIKLLLRCSVAGILKLPRTAYMVLAMTVRVRINGYFEIAALHFVPLAMTARVRLREPVFSCHCEEQRNEAISSACEAAYQVLGIATPRFTRLAMTVQALQFIWARLS